MSNVLKQLKEKFPDLYNLLLNNQGANGLVFFVPNNKFYTKDLLDDRNFYYSHIFQRSKYDSSLYVNFVGRVLQQKDPKIFETFIGWTNNMKLCVKTSAFNEDNLYFYITDGICIDELTQISKIGKESETTFEIERFKTSKEYIKHYNDNLLKDKKQKKFRDAKKILNLCVSSLKNNNILMKGHEESYSKVFQENIENLIGIFSNHVFVKNEVIAKEYVDTFVFKELYPEIMSKLRNFYEEEEKELSKKIQENIKKFTTEELKLPDSIKSCDFSEVYEKLKHLDDYQTSFEKTNYLAEINKIMIDEAKTCHAKQTGEAIDPAGDFILICWIYVIVHSGATGLIAESLFFKLFQVKKGCGSDDYIRIGFVSAVETLRTEMLRNEGDVNIYLAKPFIVETEE